MILINKNNNNYNSSKNINHKTTFNLMMKMSFRTKKIIKIILIMKNKKMNLTTTLFPQKKAITSFNLNSLNFHPKKKKIVH